MEGQQMPAHGAFCWNELGTTDAAAAKKFYTDLLGWEWKEGDMGGGMIYNEIVAGGRPSGGLFQLSPECPGPEGGAMRPQWGTYVAVDDVDAAAQKVAELGGKVTMGPMDIPNVGRFCVINDPAGATLSLITLAPHGA